MRLRRALGGWHLSRQVGGTFLGSGRQAGCLSHGPIDRRCIKKVGVTFLAHFLTQATFFLSPIFLSYDRIGGLDGNGGLARETPDLHEKTAFWPLSILACSRKMGTRLTQFQPWKPGVTSVWVGIQSAFINDAGPRLSASTRPPATIFQGLKRWQYPSENTRIPGLANAVRTIVWAQNR